MKIPQLDVVTAFLNAWRTDRSKEEIYMKHPEGYKEPGKENSVCR